MREERRRQKEEKQEWNASTTSEARNKVSMEDRAAARIAAEVLKDNKKLGGVHSAQSI
jgi:hypothetical protein